MRIHFAISAYVLFFAFRLGLSRLELGLLLLAIGMVTCAETMNTSVEKLCDRVNRDYDKEIGRAKDLAAGAVLLSAVFAALVGCTVFLRPEMWGLLADVACTPWKLGALAFSLLVSAILIFIVPKRE